MSRPASPSNESLARRVAAPESRMADIEGPFMDTQYRHRREAMAARVVVDRIAAHLGLSAEVSEEEIDAAFDRET